MIKNKNIRTVKENIFTLGFFVFLFFFLMFAFLDRGKLVDGWDEFSHWADIVKVMTSLDDFGTNPKGGAYFQSYPPGMSLFQYFVQKMTALFNPTAGFSEWRLYFSYQIFFVSFMLPFFKDLSLKQPFVVLTFTIAVLLCPLLFFADVYDKTYIDPFLGLLSGTGLAAVFLCEKRDVFYSLRVLMTCSMLVLAKDAGMLFAIFLGVAYVLDSVILDSRYQGKKNRKKYLGSVCAAALLAIVIPKALWSIHIKVRHARILFSDPIDIGQLINVILGRDDTYRVDVWKNFYPTITTTGITIGNTGISLTYMVLFSLFLTVLFCVLFCVYGRKSDIYNKKARLLIGIVCIQTGIYTVGLCITYMFKFGEYEGTRYASLYRYMNIAFLAEWIVIVLLLLIALQRYVKVQKLGCAAALSTMIIVSPMESVCDFIQRTAVKDSIDMRAQYAGITAEIESATEEDSIINLISQESTGLDSWVIHFIVRPRTVLGPCSIGEPFYEGDIWTAEMTKEEWQEYYLSIDADYVALYRINDYFIENYGALFEEPDEIEENKVYRVNKNGLLQKCK